MKKVDVIIICIDGYRIDTKITCFQDLRTIVGGNLAFKEVNGSSLVVCYNSLNPDDLPLNEKFPKFNGTIAFIEFSEMQALPMTDDNMNIQ